MKTRLKGEGHSKNPTFLSPQIAGKHWVFPLTEVSDFEVAAILKKFVSEEAQNSTLDAAFLKLYLAARPCLCDVIPSNLKLAGMRKTYNWLGILHKVSKMNFSQAIIHFTILTAIIFGDWSVFGSK